MLLSQNLFFLFLELPLSPFNLLSEASQSWWNTFMDPQGVGVVDTLHDCVRMNGGIPNGNIHIHSWVIQRMGDIKS